MKNLFYLSALSTVIFIASCTKADLVAPGKNVTSVTPISTHAGCDSVKFVNYVLTNLTGVPSYIIAFSGPQNYSFTFPASGSITVAVKPGNYSVSVYSPGNYTKHMFHLNDLDPVAESGAKYDNVLITPCTATQQLVISQ
ncbi:MAG TPA: hypothetical protein VGN20_06800 [Mucilaginibacter sp.]|jgi:hypothetical protein